MSFLLFIATLVLNIYFTEPSKPSVHQKDLKISQNSFSFELSPPSDPKGVIKSFGINIQFLNFSYFRPSDCIDNFSKNFTTNILVKNVIESFSYNEAYPFAHYKIQINAKNNEEESEYSDPIEFKTLPGD